MTEPRDMIDDWLGEEVKPLPAAPGTFDRIHRKARRRKLNQAVAAATGTVAVIAIAVAVPHLVPALHSGGSGGAPQPIAGASHSPASPATPPSRVTSAPVTPPDTAAASQPPSGTALSTTTSGTAPPPHFRPTSVTVIGAGTQYVGAVIGQAGPPCATSSCTSLAGTSNNGASWYGVSAPKTGGADGPSGVSQLRFLNLSDGWAFGPQLQETSDGGRSWVAEQTSGLRVTDLETADGRAFALFASCTGTGARSLEGCTSYSLFSSPAGSTTWTRVTLHLPPGLRVGAMGSAGHPSSATLVLSGSSGYLLTPAGDVLIGPLDGGAWNYLSTAPCKPGGAWPDGQPRDAQFAVSAGRFLIVCSGQQGSALGSVLPPQLWESPDGGQWNKISSPPADGQLTSLASASGAGGPAVLAATSGIDYTPDGVTWRRATITGGAPAGGFSYVGMTSQAQGVAVPAQASHGEVFVTKDGGLSWDPSPISG